MAGTDIYIISGTRNQANKPLTFSPAITKQLQRGNVKLTMANGHYVIMPVALYELIRATYGQNKRGIGAATITADSTPDFDEWGWDDYWGCGEWMLWHKANVQAYGKETANTKFIQAWSSQDSFMSPYNWCKYDKDFANYFAQQGIDVGWLLSNLVVGVENVGGDVIDTVENTTGTIAYVSSGLKVVATLAVIGAGIYAFDRWVLPTFKKRKKGNG